MSEKLLDVHVRIGDSYSVTGSSVTVNMVTFGGNSTGIFSGTILPSAVDTQIYSASGNTLSARYMLEGTDCAGENCRMFIDNYKDDGSDKTVPKITTDSKLLSWLEGAELEGVIVGEDEGIRIEIYEKTGDFIREEHSFDVGKKKIYGEMYTPCNVKKPYPTVIMSHGYNCCAEVMRREAEKLASRGLCVYAYDFCGGGWNSKSSGKSTEMSVVTEQQDLRDVLAHIESLGISDGIWLYGASQGGFVTGLTAPGVKDRIRGIFLMFPAFCIPDDWRERKREYTGGDFDFWGLKLGQAFMDGLPEYDVFEKAAEYDGSVYIFHGTDDSIVRKGYAEKLSSSYGENSKTIFFPGEGHGFSDKCLTSCAGYIAKIIGNNTK